VVEFSLGGHKDTRGIVSLLDSVQSTEQALIKSLDAKRGIADATGKGNATENLVEQQLLAPYLPPGFRCLKGSVVASGSPDQQSPPIDRVIYEPGVAPPLLYDEAHSVFPIESVAGVVEITMNLDADKLRDDLHRIAPVKAMQKRRYLVPVPNTTTRVGWLEQETLSPRSFIIGLPADSAWKPETIARALRERQLELGPPTHLHGLYVLGIGYFVTIAIEPGEPAYRIGGWTGPDRLFRFANGFRQAFQRWLPLLPMWSADLDGYMHGEVRILAE
jgi:hypothetical protein